MNIQRKRMGVAPAIDLTAGQRRTVLALLNRYLPGTAVWAYGSRVKWTSHPASDLDLVAFAKPEQVARLAELREAFDESNLPFRVDLFVWDDVSEGFKKRIEDDHVLLTRVKEARNTKGRWVDSRWGDLATLEYGKALRDYRNSRGSHSVFGTNGKIGHHFDALSDGPTVIVGRKGAYRGVHYSSKPCWVIDTAFYLNPQKNIDMHWAYYELLNQDINKLDSGSAIPSTSREDFYVLPVTVPPIQEQRSIAHILGTLDDKIELNRRMSETLDKAVRILFKSWFVDSSEFGAKQGAPPLSSGDLKEYASLNPESWSATNRPESVAYVDLSNTKWGTIEKIETYEWSDAPSRARRVVRPGDTIVGTVRPGNGSFALVGKDGLTASTGFAVLRPKADFDAQFVWCAATSKDNIERLAHLADGGAYPAVPAEAVAATPVVLADVSTRSKFSDATAPLVAKYLACSEESRTLADLRDTLLPKLISGEIRIRNAEKIAEAAT